MNKLNADELGEKGESRFKEICADAKLICNKADRDRTGWDFIVELPIKQDEKSSFDKRKIPFSAHIQVKTVQARTKRISMRLTSAERLAKEPKPSFVYVLRVDTELNFIDAYLIHLIDDKLGKILKRLRKEKAKGTPASDLNKKCITFKLNEKTEKIKVSGKILRLFIERICKSGMHRYIMDKEEQLEKLGFTSNSHTGKMSISAKNNTEFIDFFLGLRNDVEISNLELNEQRFGIELPIFKQADNLIAKCTPTPSDTCTISFKETPLSIPTTFDAEMFTVPMGLVPEGEQRVLIKTNFFSFDFDFNQQASKCNIKYCLDSEAGYPPKDWVAFWKTIKVLNTKGGAIEIKPKSTGKVIKVPSGNLEDVPMLKAVDFWVPVLTQLEKLFAKGSVSDLICVQEHEVKNKVLDINYAAEFIDGSPPRASFSFGHLDSKIEESVDVVMVLSLVVGSVCLAYYGIVQFKAKETSQERWSIKSLIPKEIVNIDKSAESFEKYVESVRQKEKVNMVLVKGYNE